MASLWAPVHGTTEHPYFGATTFLPPSPSHTECVCLPLLVNGGDLFYEHFDIFYYFPDNNNYHDHNEQENTDVDDDNDEDSWRTLETINGYADVSVLLAKLVTLNEVIGLPFR